MWITLIGSVCGILASFAWSLFYPIMDTYEFWLNGVKYIILAFTVIGFVVMLIYWYRKKLLFPGLTFTVLIPICLYLFTFFGRLWLSYDIFFVQVPYFILMIASLAATIICFAGSCSIETAKEILGLDSKEIKQVTKYVDIVTVTQNDTESYETQQRIANQTSVFQNIRKRHKVKFKSKLIKRRKPVRKQLR